jgi:thiol-disulfide isomerase/thioredoxin
MEQYPSLSQSIYSIRPNAEGGLVAAPVMTADAPVRANSGCWIAGFVITIIIIALVIWLVVVLVNNPDTGCVDNSCNGGSWGSRSCRVASDTTTSLLEYAGEDDLKDHTSNGIVIIIFVADWCGHCKAFKPEIVKAAAMLAEKNSNHKIMTCTDKANAHTAEAQKAARVQGFPTVTLVPKGKGLDDLTHVQLKERSSAALIRALEEAA